MLKVGRDAATSDFVQVFLGIPYASPPTGNYRLHLGKTHGTISAVQIDFCREGGGGVENPG